jgi:predicted nucleic acid-binding protein
LVRENPITAYKRARLAGIEYIDPVLDTCVLIDMFDPSCKRHKAAIELGHFLRDNKLICYMPWSSMFEVNRVIMNIRMNNPKHELSDHFDEDNPIVLERVPIDAAFYQRYFVRNLPYTKAADMLFLSMAYVDKRPLITEDDKLIKAALKAKVQVFRSDEYIRSAPKLSSV